MIQSFCAGFTYSKYIPLVLGSLASCSLSNAASNDTACCRVAFPDASSPLSCKRQYSIGNTAEPPLEGHLFFKLLWPQNKTRESSCVNAWGIPPAAYQVLHLLSYPGVRGGYPILSWLWGTPSWPGGTPSLDGGYLIPSLDRGYSIPGWGTPHLDLAGAPPVWTWLGYPCLDLARVLLSGPSWVPPPVWTWPGYPPGVNRLKTLPSPSFGCGR